MTVLQDDKGHDTSVDVKINNDISNSNNQIEFSANCNELDMKKSIVFVHSHLKENDHSTTNKTKKEDSINNKNEKYYCDFKDSFLIYLITEQSIRLEFYPVPLNFQISNIEFIIIKDTDLRKDSFKICQNGVALEPNIKLASIGNKNEIINFELKLVDNSELVKFKLGLREVVLTSGLAIRIYGRKLKITDNPLSHEDILVVSNNLKTMEDKTVVQVKWLLPNFHKPFLGGFYDKRNKTKYYNASAQTKQIIKNVKKKELFCRNTQTYKVHNFGQMTHNDMSTQFTKPGFYVPNDVNKLKIAGQYETADKYLARILKMIIIIQKYIRRWLAKKRVQRLIKLKNDFLEWEKSNLNVAEEKRAQRLAFDLEHRLHPKTAADFDRLYNALEMWRLREVEIIKEQTSTEAEKKAALAILLEREIDLINAITKHQISVSKQYSGNNQISLLKKASAPHNWVSSRTGKITEVATTDTIKAKELLSILQTLCTDGLTPSERLDILLTVKKTAKQYDFKIAHEIIELVDREAELIARGIAAAQLAGLRQRIKNRFMQFAKLPEVNPEILKYLVVSDSNSDNKMRELQTLYHCPSCDKYMKHVAFPLGAKAKSLAPCESCRRQNNRGRKRLNFEAYQYMLIDLRKQEMNLVEKMKKKAIEAAQELELQKLEQGKETDEETLFIFEQSEERSTTPNPYPFLVDKEDIRFIVDEIWEKRSVLSGCTDIIDLTLTRWKRDEPWSPWNTMLVTHKEAEAHLNLDKLNNEEAYADSLISVIKQRLIMGRNAFFKLQKNGQKMSKEILQNLKPFEKYKNNAFKIIYPRTKLPSLDCKRENAKC